VEAGLLRLGALPGPKKDLRAAFVQLQQYRESLENPPLLIVSDMAVIEVHTNFTNSVKARYVFTLDDLLDPKKRDLLAKAFDEPGAFRVAITPERRHARRGGQVREARRHPARPRRGAAAGRALPDPPALLPVRRGRGAAAEQRVLPVG
jgi:hypothetical protein